MKKVQMQNPRESQHARIWRLLEASPNGITPMDAWNLLFITKLATRIGEMIRDGYPIEKVPEVLRHEDGTTVRYMRYRKAA